MATRQIAAKALMKTYERDIQKAILDFLQYHPKVAWVERMNTGAAKMQSGNFVRFAFSGCSDIIGQLKTGQFLAVEVKNAKGKVTADQADFIARVRKSKGFSIVAFSVEDVERELKNF